MALLPKTLGSVCKLNEGEAFVPRYMAPTFIFYTNASPLHSNVGLCRHALVFSAIASEGIDSLRLDAIKVYQVRYLHLSN